MDVCPHELYWAMVPQCVTLAELNQGVRSLKGSINQSTRVLGLRNVVVRFFDRLGFTYLQGILLLCVACGEMHDAIASHSFSPPGLRRTYLIEHFCILHGLPITAVGYP